MVLTKNAFVRLLVTYFNELSWADCFTSLVFNESSRASKNIGVRAIFFRVGVLNHFPKKITLVDQIFTKQSSTNNFSKVIECCLLETFTFQLTDAISLQFMAFG